MALTRKFLATMGIEDDKIDQIIEAHTSTLTEIKTERDEYKSKAESLPEIQKQLDDANEVIKNSKDDTYKVKYDALKEEFTNFKNDLSAKEILAKKTDAYRALLSEIGIADKRLDAIIKVSDIDSLEVDTEGNIVKAKDLKETLKEEWSDFIVDTSTQGANTPNPPVNGVGEMTQDMYDNMSLAEKMEYANEHPSEAAKFN